VRNEIEKGAQYLLVWRFFLDKANFDYLTNGNCFIKVRAARYKKIKGKGRFFLVKSIIGRSKWKMQDMSCEQESAQKDGCQKEYDYNLKNFPLHSLKASF